MTKKEKGRDQSDHPLPNHLFLNNNLYIYINAGSGRFGLRP